MPKFDPDNIPSLAEFLTDNGYKNLGQVKAEGMYGKRETAILLDTGDDLMIGRTWFHQGTEKIGKCVHVPYSFMRILAQGIAAVSDRLAKSQPKLGETVVDD